MRFHRRTNPIYGLEQITLTSLINVVFLVITFFMLSSAFVAKPTVRIKLPKAITSEIVKRENLVIVVTGEDVIYFNNSVLTMQELQSELSRPSHQNLPILIKADRRASVDKVIDIWDLCRQLNIEQVSIATD